MLQIDTKKDALLSIKNLKTSFRIEGNYYAAVDNLSLEIRKNEVFAIVGESGCGKSALALSIPMLHNENYTRIKGEINFEGKNIIELTEAEKNKIRGAEISMIFQDPLSALNPLLRIGGQIEESLTYHTDLNKEKKKQRALELLNQVGIKNPERTYESFPHELSGGMRQRVMIAIAIACKPQLIIADEPTTALDVTIQAQILDLLLDVQKEVKSSIIIITHDLGVVSEIADRVAVMYGGQIVELGDVYQIFENPKHPYTRSLLASIPKVGAKNEKLKAIQGSVPTLKYMPREGCRFKERVPWIGENEHEEKPTYHEIEEGHKVLCTCYQNFRFEEIEKGAGE